MQTLIEQLQPHNLPHLPDGSFIITDKQREAILSLLSQQEAMEAETLKAYQLQCENDAHCINHPSAKQNFYPQQAVVVGQTDEEAINAYTERRHFNKSESMLVGEGFAVGCLHVRQQLSGKGYTNGWEEGFAEGRQQLSKEQEQREEVMREMVKALDRVILTAYASVDPNQTSCYHDEFYKAAESAIELLTRYNNSPKPPTHDR